MFHLMPTLRADALPIRTGCIGSPHTTRPVFSALSAASPLASSSTSKHSYTSCFLQLNIYSPFAIYTILLYLIVMTALMSVLNTLLAGLSQGHTTSEVLI